MKLLTFMLLMANAAIGQISPVKVIPTGSDLDIQVGLIHLPRESPANLAVQSSTWTAAAANAVTILLAGSQSAGTNEYNMAERSGLLEYQKMVTSTAFQSWRASPHAVSGNNQFGNRAHFPVTITSNKSGVTFALQDVTETVRSVTRSSSGGWVPDGTINTTTTLTTLNSTRLRLLPGGVPSVVGDTVHPTQSSTAPSESAAFVGIGVAFGAFGSGDATTQLQNTVNYYVGSNFAIEVEVTVGYTDNGSPRTAVGKTVFISTNTQSSIGTPIPTQDYQVCPGPEGLKTILLQMSSAGGDIPSNHLFQLQAGSGLDQWYSIGYPALLGDGVGLVFPTGDMPVNGNRCFFRIIDLMPPASTVERATKSVAAKPPVDVAIP